MTNSLVRRGLVAVVIIGSAALWAAGCTTSACHAVGQSCASTSDCCSGLTCVAGVCAGGATGSNCIAPGKPCATNAGCCGASPTCVAVCSASSCQAVGAACSSDDQCCSGLTCNANTCN